MFFQFIAFPGLMSVTLRRFNEKMADCETTTGHVGPMARTLMKDARRGLNRLSGIISSPGANQALPARVQPASHQHVQCIGESWPSSGGPLFPFRGLFLKTLFVRVQALLACRRKSSPYFNTAHASRAFFAAIATTARQ